MWQDEELNSNSWRGAVKGRRHRSSSKGPVSQWHYLEVSSTDLTFTSDVKVKIFSRSVSGDIKE